MSLWRVFWCSLTRGHTWFWRRNIYGDEINVAGGNRSVWRCARCGHYKLRPYLVEQTEAPRP